MNVVRNAIWFIMLFAFIFMLGFLFYISPKIMDGIYTATNNASPSTKLDTQYIDWLNFKTLFIQSFYSVTSFLVFMTLVSSLFDAQSMQGYILSVVGGLIATPIVIYIVATFWNTFAVMGISFTEVSTVFISDFPLIMLANFIAGLLAFVFMRKGARIE